MSEAGELTKYIIDELNSRGWTVWRNNSGQIRSGPYVVRLAPKYTLDIMGHTDRGEYVAIEIKIGKDVPSAGQLGYLFELSKMPHAVTGLFKTQAAFDNWIERRELAEEMYDI